MYIWDSTNPRRDGAMENDIVVHEMTHGITNRMTGGGTGRCLQMTEAAGLGEGWSDAMAEHVIFLLVSRSVDDIASQVCHPKI
jgi:extracellular elastinolytic metalloproteinase